MPQVQCKALILMKLFLDIMYGLFLRNLKHKLLKYRCAQGFKEALSVVPLPYTYPKGIITYFFLIKKKSVKWGIGDCIQVHCGWTEGRAGVAVTFPVGFPFGPLSAPTETHKGPAQGGGGTLKHGSSPGIWAVPKEDSKSKKAKKEPVLISRWYTMDLQLQNYC